MSWSCALRLDHFGLHAYAAGLSGPPAAGHAQIAVLKATVFPSASMRALLAALSPPVDMRRSRLKVAKLSSALHACAAGCMDTPRRLPCADRGVKGDGWARALLLAHHGRSHREGRACVRLLRGQHRDQPRGALLRLHRCPPARHSVSISRQSNFHKCRRFMQRVNQARAACSSAQLVTV